MTEYTGKLSLTIKGQQGKSVPDELYFQGALKVMRPQYLDESGQLTFFILNPGGGYLDGDRCLIDVHLKSKTNLYLTTQSATKIYCTPKGFVHQLSNYHLASDSELVSIPDPIIPYEKSRYFQEQFVYLQKGASCFLSELITPGWDSNAQGFTYTELNLLTKVFYQGKLAVSDRLSFRPQEKGFKDLGMLEGHRLAASLLVIHEKITSTFIQELYQEIQTTFPHLTVGLSELSIKGFSLRSLGESTQELQSLIYYCYKKYSRAFTDRKEAIYRKY